MNLLDDIRADLVNESADLSNTLRKARILASQINLPEFKEWLSLELNGYGNEDTLPEYRCFPATNLGMFSGSFGSSVKNMVIPTYNLPESVREYAENLTICDGVGSLQGMLSRDLDAYQERWPQEAVMLARESVQLTGNMVLVDVHRPIPRHTISGVLDNIKNKLLDFILAMQESDITPEDLDNRKVEPAVARTIFNTVNVYGNNAVIATGETINQEINLVRQGDVDSLLNHLREVGVDDNSLCELKEAVASEPSTSDGNFGPKVRAWLGGMLEKASSKAWGVGVETASKELLDALKSFYGM